MSRTLYFTNQLKAAIERAAEYELRAANATDQFLLEQYKARARFYHEMTRELRALLADAAPD